MLVFTRVFANLSLSDWRDGFRAGGSDLNCLRFAFGNGIARAPPYSHNVTVRVGDWKLVLPCVPRKIPESESNAVPILFDLSKDPAKSTDVVAEHPQPRDRLFKKLVHWSEKVERDRLREPAMKGKDKRTGRKSLELDHPDG